MAGPSLHLPDRELVVDSTLVMGVLNASPESFSDAGRFATFRARVERGEQIAAAGAQIVDVGGQSAITGQDETPAAEEVRRVVPVVQWLRQHHPELIVSVDTYKPEVVRQTLAAGAHIINDVSGLRYPEVAELCAQHRAGLVVMHTKAAPKQRLEDPDAYRDVVGEVLDFLENAIERARGFGVADESIIVDPGPDFAKTPHQTIEVLRHIEAFRCFARPLLLALSRKDFLGAILERPPQERDAATIAALAHVIAVPGNIARVHDVRAAVDAVRTIDTLTGRSDVAEQYRLPDRIRHQPPATPAADEDVRSCSGPPPPTPAPDAGTAATRSAR